MASAPCPSCGSTDVRRTEHDQERCNVCDALYTVDDRGAVRILEPGRPVAPQVRQTSPAAWVALAIGALGALLIGLWLWSPTPAKVDEGPALAVNVPEKLNGVSVKINRIREGRTADDHAFWIMTLHNDGTRPVRAPAAVIRLYDANGASMGEVRGNAWADVLEAGADVDVLAIDDRTTGHDRSEADLDNLEAAPRGAKTTALMLRTTSVEPKPDGAVIQGEVINTRDVPMRVSSIQVVGRTREGSPVAWATAEPAERLLAPGATTTFEAKAGRIQVDVPDTWTAFAVTKPESAPPPAGGPEAPAP